MYAPAPAPAPAPAAPHPPPGSEKKPAPSTNTPAASKEAPKKREFDTTEKAKLYGGFVVSMIGLILGIIGYAAWKEKTDDFNGIVDNWERQPIIDVAFSVGACPAGFQPEPLAHVGYTRTTTTTTTNSDGTTSTTTTTSSATVDLPFWGE